MAGQLKEVRNRIKSVQSTQQITKAMKMVSAAQAPVAGDEDKQNSFNRSFFRQLQTRAPFNVAYDIAKHFLQFPGVRAHL